MTRACHDKVVPVLQHHAVKRDKIPSANHSLLISALDGAEWSASIIHQLLYPQEKGHLYPLERRLGGPHPV
jgi:hypothetical protein